MTIGIRKYTDENGRLYLAEGEYGQNEDGVWMARPPGGHLGNLSNHDVVEHEDGSITVSPSILITEPHPDGERRWHGYLERGIWRGE